MDTGRADSEKQRATALWRFRVRCANARASKERPSPLGSTATAHLISLAARAPRRPRFSRRDPERLVARRHVRRLRAGCQSRHPRASRGAWRCCGLASFRSNAAAPWLQVHCSRRAAGCSGDVDRPPDVPPPTDDRRCRCESTAPREARLIWPAAIAVAAALAATLITTIWLRPSAIRGVQSGNRSQCAALFCADRSASWRWSCQRDFRATGRAASSVSAIDGFRGPSGVTHVLDGEIVTDGAAITVLARLQDVAKRTTVWSERIVVRTDQLFSVEDAIAERVVSALRLRLAAAEQDRLRRRYTSNSEAYLEYLRGRAALAKYTPEATMTAVGAFDSALERDGNYALARAGLAMACADMYLRFAAANEVERWGERAETEARAALALDPDLAEAHLARAAVARKREFDWNATITAGRRALVLNPNLEQARFFVAAAFYHNGYMEEALSEMEKGRSLHGVDVIEPIRIEALVALFSGSFAPARAHLEEVSRLSSQAIGDTYLALAYYYSGSVDRGRAMLESLVSHRSASTAARAGAALAGILAAQGESPAARTLRRSRTESRISRPSRRLQPRGRLRATWRHQGISDDGFTPPLIPDSPACHGSSAIPCSSRFVVFRNSPHCSNTFASVASPRARARTTNETICVARRRPFTPSSD